MKTKRISSKWIALLCAFSLFFSSTGILSTIAKAEENDYTKIQQVIHSYFDSLYSSLVSGKAENTSTILGDTALASIPQKIIEKRTLIATTLNDPIDSYDVEITFNNLDVQDNYALAEIWKYAEYHYVHASDDLLSAEGCPYSILLQKTDGKWEIMAMTSESDIDLREVQDALNIPTNLSLRAQKTSITQEMVDNYFSQSAACIREVAKTPKVSVSIMPNNQKRSPYLYPFNGQRAQKYARQFANEKNDMTADEKIFNEYSADCTNFVSQCLWAGYGGWFDTQTVAYNRNRVINEARMVPGSWTGSVYNQSNNSTYSWINVDGLYNFLVGSHTYGPVIDTSNIQSGHTSSFYWSTVGYCDILQFNQDGSDWGHSAFVTNVEDTSSGRRVYICAHSANLRDESVTRFSTWAKTRDLKVLSATFNQ